MQFYLTQGVNEQENHFHFLRLRKTFQRIFPITVASVSQLAQASRLCRK